MRDNIKILFATDFGPSSKIALQILKALRKTYQTSVVWQHVITSFWRQFFSPEAYKKEALQRLKTWKQISTDLDADKDEIDVIIGNPADCILSLANKKNVDLILLGSESIQGNYCVSGTTAQTVVRNAKQSVWIGKKESISHVICGIDGSATSAKALNEAINICERFSAKLSVVSVLVSAEYNPLGLDREEIKKLDEKFKQKNIVKIENFLKQFDFNNIDVSFHYPWGVPSNLILNITEDFDHDLIIIGASGESKLKQVLIGSTADKIIKRAPCSLLVVR